MKEDTKVLLGKVTRGMIAVAEMIRHDTNEALSSEDYIDAIKHYVGVREAVETIKTARKALEEIEEQMSKQQIPDLMRARDVKSVKIEGIGTVGISNRISCSIPDKDIGFKWLRDNGHGSLITETVNSSTLSAFAKDMIENEGIDLPADVFKVSTSSYTSIRK